METIKNRLLGVALFSPAPFYFFPPKAALNTFFGSDFEIAYYHFRENHRNIVNLGLHLVCFFVQITGNFALLNQIDRRRVPQLIPGVRLLSAFAAVLWTVYNFKSKAPLIVSCGTAACLAFAYSVAPLITPQMMDSCTFGGFLTMLVLSNIASSSVSGRTTSIVSMPDMVKVFVGLPVLRLGFQYAEQEYFKSYIGMHDQILKASLAYVVALPLLLRNPLKPLVVSSVFLLRAAYIASGDEALFWLGYGFFASLLQGITHKVSREEATLIALERKSDAEKIQFEYAHVTYFPNLAINSIYDTIRGVAPPERPKHMKSD